MIADAGVKTLMFVWVVGAYPRASQKIKKINKITIYINQKQQGQIFKALSPQKWKRMKSQHAGACLYMKVFCLIEREVHVAISGQTLPCSYNQHICICSNLTQMLQSSRVKITFPL